MSHELVTDLNALFEAYNEAVTAGDSIETLNAIKSEMAALERKILKMNGIPVPLTLCSARIVEVCGDDAVVKQGEHYKTVPLLTDDDGDRFVQCEDGKLYY